MSTIGNYLLNAILQASRTELTSNYKEYFDSQDSSIKFLDCTVDENIFLDLKNHSMSHNIIFIDVTFKEPLTFNSGNFWGNILFVDCNFDNSVIFTNKIGISNIKFTNCNAKIHIKSGEFGTFSINKSTGGSLLVTGGRISLLTTHFSRLESLRIACSQLFIDQLSLAHLEKTKVEINNATLNSLYLIGSYDNETSVNISNLQLTNLKFDRLINRGEFRLNNVKACGKRSLSKISIGEYMKSENLSLKNFVNSNIRELDSESSIHDLRLAENHELLDKKLHLSFVVKTISKTTLEFEKAELGNINFKNVELHKFDQVTVIDTDLSSIKTFNSIFRAESIVGSQQSIYETFNDLYTVAKNKNNKREQAEYYKASKKALLKSFKKKWWRFIPSIISLTISQWYSSNGTRWPQAIAMTILISTVLFSSVLLSTTYDLDFSEEGRTTFWELFRYYIQFLDPTHKLNFMDQMDGTTYSQKLGFVVADLFCRIFVAIGIYETILSFRKYVRS